uniref:Cuticle protein 4 n=1 Tax=Blaberus craniifer TaxID=6982 RepID=CU04_BLACR|nr:RecName: Full=Cuticle protein 4; AltName: Full=Bc-NCP4 [Blaberus craniifer]
QAVLYPSIYSILSKSKVRVQELEPVEGAAVPADTKKAEIKEKEHEVITHGLPVPYSSVVQPIVSSVVVNPGVIPAVVPVDAPTPADTKKAEISDNAVVAYHAAISPLSVVSHPVVSPLVHVPQVVYV